MNQALSRPSPSRRSGLLCTVIGAHVGILLLMLTAKTVAPQIFEMPLIVDMLPPEAAKAPAPKPIAKPEPVHHKPPPVQKTATPLIEASSKPTPAPATSVTVFPENRPVAPTQPAATEPLSQARFDADYLKNPPPPYPPMSRRLGEEGKIVLRVSVTPQGAADSVDIKTSSGSSRLDDAAVNTVKHWKFIPAKRGDNAVQSWVLVPIIFKLEQ